tara:strand:+ start:1972 stop:2118 length:147 start_codon:yes stop_codon:yes gene_type:complete
MSKKHDYDRIIEVIVKRYGINYLVAHPYYETKKGYRTKVQKKFEEYYG